MRKTYLNMKNLIEQRFYPDADTVMSYLDLFVMMARIIQEEYQELALLTAEKYPCELQPEETKSEVTE